MRIIFKKSTSEKVVSRLKKKARVRKKIHGDAERPRLSVFRSARHIYVQIVDDVSKQTLVSASTLESKVEGAGRDAATKVGKIVAERALAKNIKDVVFDRNGYLFHGRVKALADGAREAGLNF